LAETGGGAPARPTGRGFGRVLVAVYGLFALAATARSAVQIATKFHQAPLAYLLSAFAAVVYIVATVSLARGDATSRRVATVAISIELAGVITVGAVSEFAPDAFPDATVWTGFGSGYGFVPLVLPFVGLWWLRHTRAGPSSSDVPQRDRSSR
jgi:cytochrome bd-type quinol oxidase subunit 2